MITHTSALFYKSADFGVKIAEIIMNNVFRISSRFLAKTGANHHVS